MVAINPEIIQTRLEAFEQDDALYLTKNISARMEALDLINFVYRILGLHRQDQGWGKVLHSLNRRAKSLEDRLQQANEQFYQTLRHEIQTGLLSAMALRHLFDQYTGYKPNHPDQLHRGYDILDGLIDGFMRTAHPPQATKTREAEMVPYEPTPASAILDLVDQLNVTTEDVFFDLGAGLGRVGILVHLLTQVSVKGIEIEPAYCRQAQRCVDELGLSNITFYQGDAREADYTTGTIFFMFTPFTGRLLQTVLAKLKQAAYKRCITLYTYGTCTPTVAQQPWLTLTDPKANHIYKVAKFILARPI